MAHKGLIAWAILGLLGLTFQAALFFKDNLAAHHPQWRAELDTLCKWVGCQIEALQVADAVLIDHAAIDLFTEQEAVSSAIHTADVLDASQMALSQWRFQMTLRNSQSISVAMPWIELTLTDLQDQPVMRKVLNPVDFGAPKVLMAGEIWSQDLRLRLANEQIGFLGYRLLTFYP
jgi:S-methylmethionine-dependent homocysteine/selenocysteine methylase